ncbi:MAG: uroporphyrinogen-III C-methyltransferase [Acidimicrobiales bacterium]|nr:uroporphyrinogen-III C-methyltransferase [Acidimicrobiales bacterium]
MTVYLVGAGPGDPGLLTVRGAEVLGRADVVVYDRLSVSALLDLAPPHAERISVAKSAGRAVMPQSEIDALLVERGRAGQEVVRLKGGDPFVFARGGEEALALQRAGVRYEVVPGVTSAIAVPAYAGIPVTLRHSSTSFTVVTGHEDPDKGGELDWEAIARVGGTIVILMGVGRLPKIVRRLIDGGLSPDTPAAAVRWGTRPEQHTVRSTLGAIADEDLAAPSTIVIGAVAASELPWFESRPLFGHSVVVTRPRHQASTLAARLRDLGAQAIEVATIEIVDPADGGAGLRDAVARVHEHDWVVLTSSNGANRFCDVLRDGRDLAGVKLAAIGPGTADALAGRNLVPDLVPERFVAESLLEAFPLPAADGGRVLLARAEVAREVLPDGLRSLGWDVEVVDAYRTVPAEVPPDARDAVAGSDVVTFTSASTVERFLDAFGADAVPPTVACIGPVTADTARRHGLRVDVVADVHTIDGLVDALVGHLADPSPAPARRRPRPRRPRGGGPRRRA